MQEGRRRGIDGTLSGLIKLGLFILIGYLILTGIYGFSLGHQIYLARSNPIIGFGSALVGRDATEAFGIQQSGLPQWVIDSPSFWFALRVSE